MLWRKSLTPGFSVVLLVLCFFLDSTQAGPVRVVGTVVLLTEEGRERDTGLIEIRETTTGASFGEPIETDSEGNFSVDLPIGSNYTFTLLNTPSGKGSSMIVDISGFDDIDITLFRVQRTPVNRADPPFRVSVEPSPGSFTCSVVSDDFVDRMMIFNPPIDSTLGEKINDGTGINDAGELSICGGIFESPNPGRSPVPVMQSPLSVVTGNQGFANNLLNNHFDNPGDTLFFLNLTDLGETVFDLDVPTPPFGGTYRYDLSFSKALSALGLDGALEKGVHNMRTAIDIEVPVEPLPDPGNRSHPAGEPETITVMNNLVLLVDAQILPHTPFGNLGGLSLLTQVVINNSDFAEQDGELQFWNQDGTDMEVTIDGVTSNRHPFTVPRSSVRTFTLDSGQSDSIQVGWALASGRSLEFSTVFSTFIEANSAPLQASLGQGGDPLRGEAGIAASDVSTFHVIGVNKTDSGFDTGVVIANPSESTAYVVLTLKDDQEEEVALQVLVLESKEQTSRFFSSLFGIELNSFSGTLVISSDTDVSVASLKTLDGIQTSSLSSGTP